MTIKKPKITNFTLAMAVTLVVAALFYFMGDSIKLLKMFELKTFDYRFLMRGPSKPPDDVVVVAIDDYSIERLGRWPWSRAYQAELVDLLDSDGAEVIGFDLILSEREESQELTTMRQLRQYYNNLNIAKGSKDGKKFGALLDEALKASDNDGIFADSIARNGNVIIALVFQGLDQSGTGISKVDAAAEALAASETPQEGSNPADMPPPDLFDDKTVSVPSNDEPPAELLNNEPPAELFDDEPPAELLNDESASEAAGELPPEELFGGDDFDEDVLTPREVKNAAIKAVKIATDSKIPVATKLLLPLPEFYSTAKDLGYVNTFKDIDGNLRWANLVLGYSDRYYPDISIKMLKEHYRLRKEDIRLMPGKGISLSGKFVPMDESGRLLINYYGPARTFKYYSYSDVIEGLLPPGTFAGKIVLVGYAATGMGDVYNTPFSQAMPGVEKHATVIGNVLQGNYISQAGPAANVIFILVVGLALGYVLPKLSPLRAAAFSVIVIAVIIGASFMFFQYIKVWTNIVYPVMNGLLVSASVITYKFFTEEKEKRLVKKAFKQYLSPALVEELVKHPENLRLGGEKKELSVLFSDIRDFTSISEKLAPDMLVSLLNVYLSAMTGIIMENKGLVDKFIGDAIMAVYGAPIPFEDHPQRACTTAVKMIKAIEGLMPAWHEQGFPDFQIGVGINTGEMIAGNMGSEERFDYTVMGDSVNLASRLEGLNKTYGTSIIISEFTVAKVEGFGLRELDMVRVKGRAEPVRIFEVMGFADDCKGMADELRLYNNALGLYRSMQWAKASAIFGDLAARNGHKVYELYKSRCAEFLSSPPPSDWDGVFTFQTKK